MTKIKRGDIVWVNLDPTHQAKLGKSSVRRSAQMRCGDEAAKIRHTQQSCEVVEDDDLRIRAVLILQNDLGNRHSKKTIIAPFLKAKNYPFIVNVAPSSENGLDKERGLDLSHIRSVSIQRVNNKLGAIEEKYWSKIKKAILIQLGFDDIFN